MRQLISELIQCVLGGCLLIINIDNFLVINMIDNQICELVFNCKSKSAHYRDCTFNCTQHSGSNYVVALGVCELQRHNAFDCYQTTASQQGSSLMYPTEADKLHPSAAAILPGILIVFTHFIFILYGIVKCRAHHLDLLVMWGGGD